MSSVPCDQTYNAQHLFPSTIEAATNMMNYSHIEPHPIAEDGLTHKVSAKRPAPYNRETTQSLLQRNARERYRVKQVNNSFSRLRQHLPQSFIADLTKGGGQGPQKNISQVDTLRIAVEYIKILQDLVNSGGSTTTQQYGSQTTANCDSASNSSFSSSSCSSSSYTPTTTPVYYTQSTSPLPPLMNMNLQQNQHTIPSYDSGTFELQQQQLATGVQELSPQTNQHHQQQQQSNQSTSSYFDGNLQLLFQPYDNFTLDEEDWTPDDEEIFDYISLLQEQ